MTDKPLQTPEDFIIVEHGKIGIKYVPVKNLRWFSTLIKLRDEQWKARLLRLNKRINRVLTVPFEEEVTTLEIKTLFDELLAELKGAKP